MKGRLERKHGFKNVERLGTRKWIDRNNPTDPPKEKTAVRFYTEEHGWVYGKLTDDASVDAFAAKVKMK